MSDTNENTLDNVVKLTDQDGNDVYFELLDFVEYQEQAYIVLLPAS